MFCSHHIGSWGKNNMDRENPIREIYGADSFSFAGIGNFFLADTDLHFTFWDWHREPNGLIIRSAVKHGKCPAFAVPGMTQAALAAIGGSVVERMTAPLKAFAS